MLALLVQTKTGTSNLASTVVTFDTNTVAGNSIVVVSGNSSSTAGDISGVTDTQGNVYTKVLATANATVGEIEIWYASGIIGGANTVTVAYTTGVACGVIIREYYGLIYANSLDKSASNTGNSNSLSSGNTSALTQTNELLIGAGLIPLANTFSAGGNFVNLVSVGAPLVVAVAAEDLFVTAGGVQSATFGTNASIQWVCAIASFFLLPTGTTTSTSSTSASSTSTSISSTSSSTSSTSSSISSTSNSTSTSSTSYSMSITTMSTSSTSSSISSTSMSSTSSSTSISSTSSSISSTSFSSTSQSSTSSSTSISSTSSSISSTSSSISSTSASTSSTSFSSTSSSLSTSTTTVPPGVTYSYEDRSAFTTIQAFTQTATWVCPANVTSVIAECWAAGGGGGGATSGNGSNGGGGGGGAYSKKTVTVTPGTSYTVSVGVGGTGGTSATDPSQTDGTAGGDSWFSTSATVLAKGGGLGVRANPINSPGTGGSGGLASAGIGDITTSGGSGASGASGAGNTGGGGGGSGGDANSGGAGASTATAGLAGASIAGIGGAGGTLAVGSPGKAPGGGGGGAGAVSSGTNGNGASGLVQLTYTTSTPPPSSNTDLTNTYTSVMYGNISTDDGDYFIEYGSEYLLAEFKYKNPHGNNTDQISITWKGRTTKSTLTSPILLQIYNQNSAAWETIDTENRVPADTDFVLSGQQTTNLSNYYDSTNTVSARIYQLVS